MIHNRLILKLAAFDVFALFASWYKAQWDYVQDLIDMAWAQRLHVRHVADTIDLDALPPLLLVMAACLLAALYLANLKRNRKTRQGDNIKRYQQAMAHAQAVDQRIASTQVAFELPSRQMKIGRKDG